MHSSSFHITTSHVDRQNSITLSGITNFLESGALLRHRGQWILIEGPFERVLDANSDEITLFAPEFYDLKSSPLLRGQVTYRLSEEQLLLKFEEYLTQAGGGSLSESSFSGASWDEPLESDFAGAFELIQRKIGQNEIQKAVPVVFARSQGTPSAQDRLAMIKNLVRAPSSLFVYGFWDKGQGVLGATPETLFEYSGGVLRSMGLAGTCPKSEVSERSSLLQDPKEMHEHLLVVEDLKTVLSAFGEIHIEGPHILELPTLFHLQTLLSVDCLKQPHWGDLAERLHPTPALGVAPRKAGYQWMKELPGQEGRGRYGAPIAFLSKQEALCLVGIRNIQWNKTISMIGSGCGIVAASDFEREWRELYQKRLSVRKILGLSL